MCGRFEGDGDRDVFCFGQVQYILLWNDHVLLNVHWLQTPGDVVTEDQRNGFAPVMARASRTRPMNTWLNAQHVVLQQHVIAGCMQYGRRDITIVVRV